MTNDVRPSEEDVREAVEYFDRHCGHDRAAHHLQWLDIKAFITAATQLRKCEAVGKEYCLQAEIHRLNKTDCQGTTGGKIG